MADNFGLKIGVEGEKQFKQALADINQSFKVLGSEMQLVTSQFDKNDQSIGALSSRNAVLNKEIDAQKEKVATLKAALDNAASSFGENDRRTQNWQIQLNKAQAELNGMERELGETEKAIAGMGDEFQSAAKDSEKFGDEVQDSGKKADDAVSRFEKLGGVLKGVGMAMGAAFAAVGAGAVAIGKEISFAVVSITKNGLDYNKQMEQYKSGFATLLGSAQNADKLLGGLSNFAAKTPFELGDLAQASQTLLAFGTAEKDIEPSLKMLGDIAMGNKEKFNGLALVFGQVQSAGKLTGQDLMQMINQGFNPLQIISQKTGESMASLKDKMSKGQISFEMVADAMKTATSAGGQFYNAMESQSRTLDGQISTLQDGFNALSGAITSKFSAELTNSALPAVNGLVSGFFDLVTGQEGAREAIQESAKQLSESVSNMVPIITEMVGTFSTIGSELLGVILPTVQENMPQLMAAASQIISMLLDGIVAALPILVTAAVQIVMTLLQGVIDALPQITSAALQLLMTLVSGILENLPALLEAAMLVVATLALGIAGALPELIPAVVQAVVLMVQTLIENLPLILDAALQIILGLVDGLLTALPKLIAALPAIILAIVDFIIQSIPQLIDAGIKLLTSLVTALPTIITAVVEAIPEIINSVINAVIGAIPLIIDAGIRLLVSLIQALPQIIITIVMAIPQIIGGLVDAIAGNIDKIILAGVQLFVALIKNLPSIIVEIVKAIPQIITGIVDAIGSLNYRLTEAGTNLVKGLWKGISDTAAWIWDKIKGFCSGIVDQIKGFFGIHSPSTVFAGLGRNMGEGVGVGFVDAMDSVAKDMRNAIPTDLGLDANLNVSGVAGGRGGLPVAGGTTINQTISVVSPKALSEKELAREFKNLSRKLALEY